MTEPATYVVTGAAGYTGQVHRPPAAGPRRRREDADGPAGAPRSLREQGGGPALQLPRPRGSDPEPGRASTRCSTRTGYGSPRAASPTTWRPATRTRSFAPRGRPAYAASCTSALRTPRSIPRCRTSAARRSSSGLSEATGLSHAILKPAIIFGREDILLNNIAWLLRRFPVHPIVGSGEYRVQPVFVEDLADLAVRAADGNEDVELDAVGPDVFSYEEMVRLIADKIGSSARLVHVRPWAAMLGARMVGMLVRDVVLTQEEIDGLTADLLVSKSGREPTGTTRLSDWLEDNAEHLGARYASELRRHYR